jgi:LPS export ABC transporter protein LptC
MKPTRLNRRKLTIVATLSMMVSSMVVTSCGESEATYVPNMDSLTTPTMVTKLSEVFITDSGYLRYHITTPIYNTFDNTPVPYMQFPDGLAFEQYDIHQRVVANGRCDSAIYYTNRRQWRFDGHVVAVNSAHDTFMTQQLFWNQGTNVMQTDSFMHIVKADYIIEGYGFSGQIVKNEMSEYTVHRPTAIIPLENRRPAAGLTGPITPAAGTDSAPTRSVGPGSAPRYIPPRASSRSGAVMIGMQQENENQN